VKCLRSRHTSSSDRAESFSDKYSTLYTSVSYNAEEMSKILSELNHLMCSSESGSYSAVSACDVLSAIKLLKAGKCN